jgi:alpha-ketoglutarate-dependent taurine dioxygenase
MWRPTELVAAETQFEPTLKGLTDLFDSVDVDKLLLEKKALIFHGFGIRPSDLEDATNLLLPNRAAYVHGNSPRTKLENNIYTSTEYPAELTISMHNELSYSDRWPTRLMFYCEQPAAEGGSTPIIDGGVWLDSIDPDVRADFAKGLNYIQNLHDGYGPGKSWQDTFETDVRDEVDEFLSGTNAEWRWKSDGGLRVSIRRPSTMRHPVTDDEVWFAQPDQWHIAALQQDSPVTAAALSELYSEAEMPQAVTFGDGSPIPADTIMHIRKAGLDNAIDVVWRTGDLVLIDNILVAHGRRPYAGRRRVLVAMSA